MACVYLCHDVEGLPRYVGEGKPERPIDHIKTEPNGLGDFYARMRRESAAGRLVRWRYLWWDLDKRTAFDRERALLTKFGKAGEGGLFYNRNGYYCESAEAAAFVKRSRLHWFLPPVKRILVSKAAKEAYRLLRYEQATRAPGGGYYLWVTPLSHYWLSALKEGRRGYSAAVMRLAEKEAA